LFALILIALSLPVFASDWAVQWEYANIRKEPSIKAMMVYRLQKSQNAGIIGIAEKGGWIKVRFDTYIPWKTYKSLKKKGAEIKRLGSEGNLVQVTISGWTKKDNLRER